MEDATTAAVADLDNKIKAIEQRLAETTSEYQGVIQNSKLDQIQSGIIKMDCLIGGVKQDREALLEDVSKLRAMKEQVTAIQNMILARYKKS